MGRAIIAFTNFDQDTTLAGGSYFAALPLDNIKDKDISKVARTTGNLTTETVFTGDMGEKKIVDFFALANHNMTQDALIRIRFSNDSGATTNVIYDTGLIKVWSRVKSTSSLKSEETNWLTGQATEAELAGTIFSNAFPLNVRNWNQVAINASDISFDSTDNSINSVSTDLSGFSAQSTMRIGGTAINDGFATITDITTNKLIVSGKTLATEAAAAGHTLTTHDVDFVHARYFRVDIEDTLNINATVTGTDISAINSDNSFNSTSTDLSVYAVGQTITVSGDGSNNGNFTVSSATSTKVIVTGGTLADESAGDSVTISAGYVEIGRLWTGNNIDFSHDFSVGGATAVEDLSIAQRALSGAKFHDIRNRLRTATFSYNGLDESEAYSNVYEMLRQRGVSGEVYFLYDENNERFTFKKSFLGRIRELNEISQTSLGTNNQLFYSWSAVLEEKL